MVVVVWSVVGVFVVYGKSPGPYVKGILAQQLLLMFMFQDVDLNAWLMDETSLEKGM